VQVISNHNVDQIKTMIRNAFDTDFFRNIRAQANNKANQPLLSQKAAEAWREHFGRFGYLTLENKKKLESLTEVVLKNIDNATKCFKANKIDIIRKALNIVIPVRGAMSVIIEEEGEEDGEQGSFTVPESIQHQGHEELNTSHNSLFGFDTTEFPMVAYGDDDHRDYELENLLGIAGIPQAVTSSSLSYGGGATSSSSSYGGGATSSSSSNQREMEMLRQENDTLKISDGEGRRLLKESQDLSEFLQGQVLHLQQQVDAIKKQVKDIELERDGWKKQVKDIEVERDGFKKQVKDVEVERDGLKKQVQDVEVERDGFKTQLDIECGTIETLRRNLEEDIQQKESLRGQLFDVNKKYLDTQYALRQWKELQGKMKDVEKTLCGAIEVVDNYDAETEVMEDVAIVGEKRKRDDDNDSECSRQSKRPRTDNMNMLILNKLAYQAILAHDASTTWRPKVQSLYEEFSSSDKYLHKVRAIFIKAEGKTTNATVKEQATIMKQFVEEIANV
jgi:predicted  nucleic acid-binding Zn-ribbon protein